MNNKNMQGYTLIELMTVVAIVGILAALALPMYNNYTGKAQVAEAAGLLKGLKTPLSEAVSSGGIVQCADSAAWFANGTTAGKYVEAISIHADAANRRCTLKARFKSSGANDNIQGRHLAIRYTAGNGGWECSTDLAPDLVTNACNHALFADN